ncbi:MAG: class I SAM-dependent methyltransferase [Firmicutes bacterium]|jgi:ubiquinone/menaquinone biosynthesis C-methylase UbiE|nr:class I SAM-dependent methyltransferase [Bacillota bacterium]
MKEAYTHLAQFYDLLMDEDYQAWASYLLDLAEEAGISPKRILELGCGTGNLSLALAACGMEVVGVDISPEMIRGAQEKAGIQGLALDFRVQDMRELHFPDQRWEIAIAACDAMNYLTTAHDFCLALQAVHRHLEDGGVFFFDLNSEAKLRELYGNNSFADLHDDFAYFWDNSFDEQEETCIMELTFFVQGGSGAYHRVQERHVQKLWRPETVAEFLEQTGFELIGCYGFMTMEQPSDDCERWQFAAKKALR